MTTLPVTSREQFELPAPAAPAAGGGAEAALTAGDIFAMIKRRSVLITILFLLLATLAVGGWLITWVYFPLYSAEAYVECISPEPKEGFELTGAQLQLPESERFIMTQAQFVKSPGVMMDTLRAADVRQTQWYRDTPQDDLQIEIDDLVKAGPLRGTNLLRIAARTRSKKDPHVIVNEVVSQYLRRVEEYSTGGYRREKGEYQTEFEAIDAQIRDNQKKLLELGGKLPPGQVAGVGNIAFEEFTQQQNIVTQYELAANELKALYQIYSQPSGMAVSPEDTQMVELDPQVAMLANQQFQYSQQLEVARKRLGKNHTQIKQLANFLEVVEQQLKDTRERRLEEILAYKSAQVQTAYLNAQHAWLLARDKLEDQKAHLADMDSVMAEYAALAEDNMLLKQTRELIRSYVRDLDRVVSQSGIRVSPYQTALEPLERSFPQPILIPAGVLVALLLAVGIAVLIEFLDKSLRTPQDVLRHLRIALLGVVPDADDEEVAIEQIETAVREAPQSMFVEAFRAIRTNLQFTAPAARQRSVLITSPRPEDGKTTIACNLAAMVAQGGRRVLLVDANFRRPSIHRFFPVRPEGGLSNILVGGGTAKDYIQTTDTPNLDVLGSGPVPPNPAELVGSQQMHDFLVEVTAAYDQVILDGPPVLLASDAALLASRTDGTILVLRANTNSRGVGSRATGLLNRVNAHLFGGVLNAARVRRGGYFREQLRTFYDYRLEEGEEGYTGRVLPGQDASPPGGSKPEREDQGGKNGTA